MKSIVIAAVLATFAVAGCSSLSDSSNSSSAGGTQSASDNDVYPAQGSPFPKATDQGKF
jgi:outer membrane murein-binding lipoprotein Lpp